MRVLHLASGNVFGGIETFLVTLAELERSRPVLSNYFLLTHQGRLAEELRGLGVEPVLCTGVRIRHPLSVLRARRECRSLVSRLRPDVVVAHGPWSYFICGHAVPSNTPLLFFQHGIAQRDALHILASWRRPTGILVASDRSATTTQRVFPSIETRVCALPVLARKPKRTREAVREELQAGDRSVILTVGRLEHGKGHKVLLEALGALKDLNWILWIVGGEAPGADARLRKDLVDVGQRNGVAERVRMLGERSDVPDLLHAADVYCQPSLAREGFGLAIVEAMAAGLPLVVTSPAEAAVRVGRELGRRADPSSPGLAQALREVLSDRALSARLGGRAREAFERDFDAGAALEKLERAIHELCRPSSVHETRWA